MIMNEWMNDVSGHGRCVKNGEKSPCGHWGRVGYRKGCWYTYQVSARLTWGQCQETLGGWLVSTWWEYWYMEWVCTAALTGSAPGQSHDVRMFIYDQWAIFRNRIVPAMEMRLDEGICCRVRWRWGILTSWSLRLYLFFFFEEKKKKKKTINIQSAENRKGFSETIRVICIFSV